MPLFFFFHVTYLLTQYCLPDEPTGFGVKNTYLSFAGLPATGPGLSSLSLSRRGRGRRERML